MLVLSRNAGENIVIGEDGGIVIRILQTKSNGVKIGIEAPKDVPVDRQEIWESKKRSKAALAK